jgi:Na+/H+-dicarboxylate symporter
VDWGVITAIVAAIFAALGIALIFATDRPLDMLRTATNVTGDLTVASIIDKLEKNRDKRTISSN